MQRVFSDPTVSPEDQLNWSTRDAEIKDFQGNVIFAQKHVEAPEAWSQLAVNIVASKYFHGPLGGPSRETSVRQLVGRVANTIASWAVKDGHFDEAEGEIFRDELAFLCLNQYGAFNSPVWFNVGLSQEYGLRGPANNFRWDNGAQAAVPCEDAYLYPQASACFIQGVEDDLGAIMDLAKAEAMLFKYGSGTGTDLSTLRSSREMLSGGGTPSGPLSFMKVYDATAGVVKSGGKCLAYGQPVFTAGGTKSAESLALAGEEFVVLSYSKRLGRVAAKRAQAWFSGTKPGIEVVTDKGRFRVSHDHPFMLRTGQAVPAGQLQAGQSLMPITTDSVSGGYVRVGLQDGRKGRELLHRLVGGDVLDFPSEGVIHHVNRDKHDSRPENLQHFGSHAEHASLHGREEAAEGRHIFQHRVFPKFGETNPMHRDGDFWASPEKSAGLRAQQSTTLRESGRAAAMQSEAARQKMLNLGYKLINAGHDIGTFEAYCEARRQHGGRAPHYAEQARKFEAQFGSYQDFLVALSAGNHRVLEVYPIGEIGVVSIEVFDTEPDDKRDWSEHNYAICPIGTTQPYASCVVVLNTRRAAKMQTLRCEHPDILEFIQCKTKEDDKAKALIAAGYEADFNGEAYGSVAFQNANLSVRASDAFMNAAEAGGPWTTTEVSTGKPSVAYPASDLMDAIAEGTWQCGDPGMQFHDTINRWNPVANTHEQMSTNPCSEFCFINHSSCNLASLNLMKFRRMDGTFDCPRFEAACRVFITAQEVLVGNCSYPTAKIAENSHKFRPLGLGYANLGCLLMSLGLPYDSDEGRSLAGAITALMHGMANLQSSRMASLLGPFEGFLANREPMLNVMRMHHAAAVTKGLGAGPRAYEVWSRAVSVLDCVVESGLKHGYRNAQVTVLAPTGTIGFMMDCDTTGVEPDIALVKYKSLAGRGNLRIVNRTISAALRALGYAEADNVAILAHVGEKETIEGAPGLKPEHLPVFDCAFPPSGGGRSIHWRGHALMLAAVQPFLSGATSKTINMPNDSTPRDIRAAYVECWKLGIKAAAIYRDGSKGSQPLTTSKQEAKAKVEPAKATRERLPETRTAVTHKFDIQGHEGYLTVGHYPDGRPGELFVTMAKEGSTVGGLVDTLGTAVSLGLQHGVPLQAFVDKFAHVRFEPSGFTKNPDVPIAKSIADYIFRWLGMRFLPGYREANAPDRGEGPKVIEALPARPSYFTADAPPCSTCGAITVRNGSCHRCMSCGESMGCS